MSRGVMRLLMGGAVTSRDAVQHRATLKHNSQPLPESSEQPQTASFLFACLTKATSTAEFDLSPGNAPSIHTEGSSDDTNLYLF